MPESSLDVFSDPAMLSAARRLSELRGGPQIAVLDTSCVRTGLKRQLEHGGPPRSIREVRNGTIRLFMEYTTLVETARRLDRFAKQFGVPKEQLAEMLNQDWLPYIAGVKLPEALRRMDERASQVEALDEDDFPAAALATLLSPAILLTHNFKDFAPLGVRDWSQGTDAVFAAAGIKDGETMFQGILIVPAAPVVAVGAGAKWVADRVGPAGWFLLPLLGIGGYYIFRRQPPERQERWKETARDLGRAFVEETSKVAEQVNKARELLNHCVVPGPESRTPISAVMRLVARSSESLSAQQICDALDDEVRPSVTDLRAYLHANKGDNGPFVEARRGGFELGKRSYRITTSASRSETL